MSNQSNFFPDRAEGLLGRKVYLNVVYLEFFPLNENSLKFAEIALKQDPKHPLDLQWLSVRDALRRGLQGFVLNLLLFVLH